MSELVDALNADTGGCRGSGVEASWRENRGMTSTMTPVDLSDVEAAAAKVRTGQVRYLNWNTERFREGFRLISPVRRLGRLEPAMKWLADHDCLTFEQVSTFWCDVHLAAGAQNSIAYAKMVEPIGRARRLAAELREQMPDNHFLLGAADLLDRLSDESLAGVEADQRR